MKSIEVRKKFFDYFNKYNHEKVASSSLIPAHNPTLLFTNAGMNQFTDVFLGIEKRSYSRAVSIQKCVRAGGKHNDLENVGFTKRHLTFFEMMGNFSFGDYFKKEAIEFAWEFLTIEMVLPIEKLHASVFTTDDEAYDIWNNIIGLPTDKIHRLGAQENFWQMGDTGPCGPCTEIHIDRGPEFGCKNLADCGPACNCDRFLEIWNLVFMQYDRQPDGNDKPLKQTGVDTGMGLERLCSVVQNVDSVYETDLFTNILKKIEALSGKKYTEQDEHLKSAFNVVAEHIRSSSMIIADGCAPSNEGRGYVLRKIIRRAALFAQKLSNDEKLFPKLSEVVAIEMGTIYPELLHQRELIFNVLDSEIKKFSQNLIRGQAILEKYFQASKNDKVITGEQAFKLYDTFGFPLEITKVIAHEKGYTVDTIAFDVAMNKQQELSSKATAQDEMHVDLPDTITTEFTGYQELQTSSDIIALIADGKLVDHATANTECFVITKKSPFFIVGGGQVPDKGWLEFNGNKVPHSQVRYINNAIAAKIIAPIDLNIGMKVTSIVNEPLRIAAMKNHTATHMLQAALMNLFGNQIKQSGSLVHPDYLRFDFTYHANLSPEDIKKVEDLVNEKIRQNIPVSTEFTSLKDALDRGVLAFFGDKYKPEKVRIVDIIDFSKELCGGTHVKATGDIGAFKITELSSPAAGFRRIVALTGKKAIESFQECFDITKHLSQEFKVKREDVLDAINKQKEQLKELQSQIKQIKSELWKSQLPIWSQQISSVNNIPFLWLQLSLSDYSIEDMREVAQSLGSKHEGFYFLIGIQDDISNFVAFTSPRIRKLVNLKNLGLWLKDNFGLRCGGSDFMLQGGGGKIDPKLKESIITWLESNN